jgi:hypothetical protein
MKETKATVTNGSDEPEVYVSINPSEQESGGGAPDHLDATIIGVETCLWDFGGKVRDEKGEAVWGPAVKITYKPDDPQSPNVVQHYSAGSITRLKPSKDGTRFVQVNKSCNAIADSSNAGIYFQIICNVGFPESALEGKPISIIGCHGHFKNIPQPERINLHGQSKGEQKGKILVAEIIDHLPWDKQAVPTAKPEVVPRAAQASVSAQKPNGAPQTGNGAVDEAMIKEAINGVLAVLKKQNPCPLSELGPEVYKANPAAKYRKQLMQYCESPEFLHRTDLPFAVSATEVSLL